MKKQRYILQPSEQEKGWYILTDIKEQVVCRFKEYEFEATQRFIPLDNDSDFLSKHSPTELARIVREMHDWCSAYYSDIIAPSEGLMDCEKIGRMIAYLRIQKGLSQRELGKKVGLYEHEVADLEIGDLDISMDELCEIARALGGEVVIRI